MKVKDILKDCSEWMPSGDYHSVMPMVSVLLPTFRRAKSGLFEAAVQSVLNQDFKNLELIIIDDGSTDGTADLIQYFMKIDPRVSCIRHRFNVGLPAISEYEGYMKARGEYIAFIFDDNEWERGYLSNTINFMRRNQAKAAYGKVRSYYGAEGAFTELGVSVAGIGINLLPCMNYIANGGVVLKREVIEAIGLYDPHVAVTRLCDWHLWKRIVGKFEFFETGIFAGIEKDATQSDSLGNAYKINSWVVAERESQVSNEMLLPGRFEEIDITMVSHCSSEFYCCAVNSFYTDFAKKDWFRQESVAICASKPLKVLVLAAAYDATMDLSFNRISKMKNEGIIFQFGSLNTTPIYEFAQADAVIFVRNVGALEGMRLICKQLKIPYYLYLDDNFVELANEKKKDIFLQQCKEMLKYERLKDYAGLIVSSEGLKRYFERYDLRIPVACMLPCTGETNIRNKKYHDDVCLSFAYMGGAFRDGAFLNCVMPALASLAMQYKIRIICPSRINLSNYHGIDNLEIVQIEYSLSLDVTHKRYERYSPQFLLHCGPTIKNNEYKTENALINATQLGAVLVASDNAPFKAGNGLFCICTQNTIEDWIRTLETLIKNQEVQKQIFNNAVHRCKTLYTTQQAMGVCKEVLANQQPSNLAEIIQRYEAITQDLLYVHSMNTLASATVGPRPTRALGQVPLSYTDGIIGRRHYQIQCTSDTFSELGICFASYGEPHGKIVVSIHSSKCKLRECVLSMEDFVHDNWTYMEFQPIDDPKNQIFDIVLDFRYDEISAQMGVFEDASKRSFLYRVLNKLGHRMNVRDLLFVDCR